MRQRITIFFVLTLLVMCLVACSNSNTDPSPTSDNNRAPDNVHSDVVEDTLQGIGAESNNENAYEGIYYFDESSSLSIVKNEPAYDVSIDIYRLAIINGTGTVTNNEMAFVGIDPNENPIGAKIVWQTDDTVVLTFTVSTWPHLPQGAEFTYHRSCDKPNTADGYNNLSEKEQLTLLLSAVEPVADASLYKNITSFLDAAFTTINMPSSERDLTNLDAARSAVFDITTSIYVASVPQGYALQNDWLDFTCSCEAIDALINAAVKAVHDNDRSTLMEIRQLCGNLGIRDKAIIIKNTLSNHVKQLEEAEKRAAIEVIISYDIGKETALRYAKHIFNNQSIIEVYGDSTPKTYTGTIASSKYYEFSVLGKDNIWILIDVTDGSALYKEDLGGGRISYTGLDEADLPAEDGELAMPDVIGMDFDQAVALIKSMGLAYDLAAMDLDNVPEGCVCDCYPSPGNKLSLDTVVYLKKEIDVNN